MRILTARWVFPVATPPIADGAVAVEAGQIAGVGARADVDAAWPDACRRYLRERLCFDLGPRHLEGLRTFLAMLTEAGVLAQAPGLQFIET